MKETISVTQADIDRAREEINFSPVPLLAHQCPISQAVKRAHPGDMARVGRPDICRWENGSTQPSWWAVTPEIADRFITRFDLGLPVEPFEFDVEWSTTDPA